MILTLAVSGYRSLRNVALPLEQLNVVTGPNGSGKSSLYRAIHLLGEAGRGRIISALAAEGGLASTLWAGPEAIASSVKRGEHPVQGTTRKNRIALKLGFASEDFGYAIDLGLPAPGRTFFGMDPEIKAEAVWAGPVMRRANVLAARAGPMVHVLDTGGDKSGGERRVINANLAPYDSMMRYAASPRETPELIDLRERMRSWRFYDQLRTDRDAPCRRPQVGTRTFALADDGADLAAAIQTVLEIGDAQGFHDAIDDAFPGSSVEILISEGYFEVALRQHGMLRCLRAAELSDGTLRYLLLTAALMTPRPPELLVLNEPETSLHRDLLPALGRLIVAASARSQVIVVSHAPTLVDALAEAGGKVFALRKEFGETLVDDAETVKFAWPKR